MEADKALCVTWPILTSICTSRKKFLPAIAIASLKRQKETMQPLCSWEGGIWVYVGALDEPSSKQSTPLKICIILIIRYSCSSKVIVSISRAPIIIKPKEHHPHTSRKYQLVWENEKVGRRIDILKKCSRERDWFSEEPAHCLMQEKNNKPQTHWFLHIPPILTYSPV